MGKTVTFLLRNESRQVKENDRHDTTRGALNSLQGWPRARYNCWHQHHRGHKQAPSRDVATLRAPPSNRARGLLVTVYASVKRHYCNVRSFLTVLARYLTRFAEANEYQLLNSRRRFGSLVYLLVLLLQLPQLWFVFHILNGGRYIRQPSH